MQTKLENQMRAGAAVARGHDHPQSLAILPNHNHNNHNNILINITAVISIDKQQHQQCTQPLAQSDHSAHNAHPTAHPHQLHPRSADPLLEQPTRPATAAGRAEPTLRHYPAVRVKDRGAGLQQVH